MSAEHSAQGKAVAKGALAEAAQPTDMVRPLQQLFYTKGLSMPRPAVISQDTDNQENKPVDNAASQKPHSNIVTSWGPVKTNKRKQPEAPATSGERHCMSLHDHLAGSKQTIYRRRHYSLQWHDKSSLPSITYSMWTLYLSCWWRTPGTPHKLSMLSHAVLAYHSI